MYTAHTAHNMVHLHKRLKQHSTITVHQNMEQSECWDTQRLDALCLKRLRALLIYAQPHVPNYRNLFARTFIKPGNMHDLGYLSTLPFLTKTEFRANQEILKADNAIGLTRFNTRGSSGEPLIFNLGNERACQSAFSGRLRKVVL